MNKDLKGCFRIIEAARNVGNFETLLKVVEAETYGNIDFLKVYSLIISKGEMGRNDGRFYVQTGMGIRRYRSTEESWRADGFHCVNRAAPRAIDSNGGYSKNAGQDDGEVRDR